MFTKIKNKMSNMTTKDWIVVSLWLLAFVMLIVFVACAAGIDHSGTDTYKAKDYFAAGKPGVPPKAIATLDAHGANTTAAYTAISSAQTSDLTINGITVSTGQVLYKASGFELLNVKSDTYANTLAATGLAFAASLIAAMFTTVLFAYNKRKNGGKN